jgi:predicted ArsR family transcriptional regulator
MNDDTQTSSTDQILYLLKTRGTQTAQSLAAELEITMEGARQHLLALEKNSLVQADDERHGRGRPRRQWSLTQTGHGRFPDTHSQLTLEMIGAVRAEFGEDALERLIARRETDSLHAYRAQLDRYKTLRAKVGKLAELRAAEGYMASVESDGRGGYLLIENHCPICAAATSCQGFCRSELEIFRRALGPKVSVERSEHLLAGARRCVYMVRATK